MSKEYEKLIQDAFKHPVIDVFEEIEKSDLFSEREKYIILHHYVDGISFEQIADDLGVTRQWVNQIKTRTLQTVRKLLYWSNMPVIKYEMYNASVLDFENLSARSKNVLMRNRLTTIKLIVEYLERQKDLTPEEAIMQFRNIGQKSAKEICAFLKKNGFLQVAKTMQLGQQA